MMKKFVLITVVALIALSNGVFAQKNSMPYHQSFGGRGGFIYGLTYRNFIDRMLALELIGAYRYKGGAVHGLFEFSKQFKRTPDVYWYWGLGMHAGRYDSKTYYQSTPTWLNSKWGDEYFSASKPDESVTTFGVDGILGMEYVFRAAPVNISLDFHPYYDVYRGNNTFYDLALSIRYIW